MDAASADAWQRYTDRRHAFTTAFWLHYLGGIVGAHRFYLGLRGSALAQLILGAGSVLAMLLLGRSWGSGVAVFLLPLAVCGLWLWWDTYSLRDLVRDHNRDLASKMGLDPAETERWDRAQDGGST